MQILTTAVHFKADSTLLDFVQERLDKLEQIHDRILDAQVTLKLENSGQVRDKIVEISLRVPGERLFAKSTDKTFEAACDATCTALRRQLHKHKERTTV
ncbi:MAG: ribosome-associated translation inhibitor RaiA [Saprospiraceae bacterium]